MTRGIFITFEGGEGSGKTTQAKLLAESLKKSGYNAEHVRSPGGTAVAEKLRAILKTREPGEDLTPETELLLFGACHSQLVERYLKPAVSAGKIVLSDRFFDSTTVYQGYARGLNLETVHGINRFACRGLVPDLTIVLDIDPEEGLRRSIVRALDGTENANDRFDTEKFDFHKAVRNGFLTLAKREPERFRVLSAAGSPGEVAQRVKECVKNVLGLEIL